MTNPVRVLIAKCGLDGHDRGARVIARYLRDSGMEVIYTGIRITGERIARIAIDEDVDVIGISSLAGSHMTEIPLVVEELERAGLSIPIIAGGVISDEDAAALRARGVADVCSGEVSLETIKNAIVQLARRSAG